MTIPKEAQYRLVENNAHIRKTGWLPRGLWPELDACAVEHDAAVNALAEARAEANELGRRFRVEDEQRVEAYKTGTEAPPPLDPAARQCESADMQAKVAGAEERLLAAAVAAIECVQAHANEWQADLANRVRDAEVKRAEAARLLAEADQAVAGVGRTQSWIERTARNRRRDHYAHDEIPIATPYDARRDLAKVFSQGGDAPTVVAS